MKSRSRDEIVYKLVGAGPIKLAALCKSLLAFDKTLKMIGKDVGLKRTGIIVTGASFNEKKNTIQIRVKPMIKKKRVKRGRGRNTEGEAEDE